jgi:hypothetical protein
MIEQLVAQHALNRLAAWPTLRRETVLLRLGWQGQQQSLQSCGTALGISRQAAQRMVERALQELQPLPTELAGAVGEAWRLAAAMAPARWTRVHELLIRNGYVKSIAPAGFLSLGALATSSPPLVVQNGYLLLDETSPPPVTRAMRLLRTKVRAGGVCRLQDVIDALGLSNMWSLEDFSLDVVEAEWPRFLFDDWVTENSPPSGRDRLANLTRKVLAACGEVSIEALSAGLERQVRFGRLPAVPPPKVLTSYLMNHGDFQVRGNAVAPSRKLDPEQELSPTELVIWRRLRDASGGSLSRDELRTAALDAGVDVPAFASAVSYSPVIESRAHGLWGLRGTGSLGTEQDEKARDENVVATRKVRSRTARASRYTWDGQGRLVVTSILASPESTVVSIPSAVQVILEGREFEAIAEDGRSVGTVKVRGGRSWGYDHFLASRRHQRGDVLTVTFDLSRRQSTLAASERPVANE